MKGTPLRIALFGWQQQLGRLAQQLSPHRLQLLHPPLTLTTPRSTGVCHRLPDTQLRRFDAEPVRESLQILQMALTSGLRARR